jgi:hypothetical protein
MPSNLGVREVIGEGPVTDEYRPATGSAAAVVNCQAAPAGKPSSKRR